MKHALMFCCVLGFCVVPAPLHAQGVKTTISVSYYQCLNPLPPVCVAPDDASKPRCCPACQAWKKVSIDMDLMATPAPGYDQPNEFLNDVTMQMYGQGLPNNSDGKPVSVSYFYRNFEKHGWVEVGKDQPKEGTIALLPTTAGIVVSDSSDEIAVVYSSTKRDGDVWKTDLNYLASSRAKPRFVVPKGFLAATATAVPPPQ